MLQFTGSWVGHSPERGAQSCLEDDSPRRTSVVKAVSVSNMSSSESTPNVMYAKGSLRTDDKQPKALVVYTVELIKLRTASRLQYLH